MLPVIRAGQAARGGQGLMARQVLPHRQLEPTEMQARRERLDSVLLARARVAPQVHRDKTPLMQVRPGRVPGVAALAVPQLVGPYCRPSLAILVLWAQTVVLAVMAELAMAVAQARRHLLRQVHPRSILPQAPEAAVVAAGRVVVAVVVEKAVVAAAAAAVPVRAAVLLTMQVSVAVGVVAAQAVLMQRLLETVEMQHGTAVVLAAGVAAPSEAWQGLRTQIWPGRMRQVPVTARAAWAVRARQAALVGQAPQVLPAGEPSSLLRKGC
jgi:hypothetical protein